MKKNKFLITLLCAFVSTIIAVVFGILFFQEKKEVARIDKEANIEYAQRIVFENIIDEWFVAQENCDQMYPDNQDYCLAFARANVLIKIEEISDSLED